VHVSVCHLFAFSEKKNRINSEEGFGVFVWDLIGRNLNSDSLRYLI